MYTVAKVIAATVLTATAVTVGVDKVPPKTSAAVSQSTARPDSGPPPAVVADADAPARPDPQPRAERSDATARASNDAEVLQLRAELAELQQRTILLEQQAQRDRDTFQTMAQQMSDIRDAAVSRESREQSRADRSEQSQAAASNLVPALQSLEAGQSDISAALDQAESTFQGGALRDVQSARAALDNNDLASARYFLTLAIREAEAAR